MNSLLGRMEIAEVVSAIDNPELLVARGGIQNFLVYRQHDERRESNLGVNWDDVGLGVLDGPRAGIRVDRLRPRQHRGTSEEKRGKHCETRDSRRHRFLLTEGHSCFWNRLTEHAAGVFLRPLGNERRDLPARRRWPRQLRRTRAREFGGEILAGRDRKIRLRSSLTALLPGSVPLRFRGGRYRNRLAFGSSFVSGQNLKAPLEAVLLESLGPFPVVKRIVRVQPVAFGVYFQVRDLGNLVVLDEKLPLGN